LPGPLGSVPALPATWKRYKPDALVGAPALVDARVDAQLELVPAPVDAPNVDAPAPFDAPSSSTRGAELLEAMLERDRERAVIKKQEAEIKKLEKAAEKDAEALKAGGNPSAKAVCKSQGKDCKLPVAKAAGAKLAKKVGNADPPQKKACVNHEASRSQYLARSAGGPSKSFAYGAGKDYSTGAKAMAAAKAWLQRQ
jgi:hypothetical protein